MVVFSLNSTAWQTQILIKTICGVPQGSILGPFCSFMRRFQRHYQVWDSFSWQCWWYTTVHHLVIIVSLMNWFMIASLFGCHFSCFNKDWDLFYQRKRPEKETAILNICQRFSGVDPDIKFGSHVSNLNKTIFFSCRNIAGVQALQFQSDNERLICFYNRLYYWPALLCST